MRKGIFLRTTSRTLLTLLVVLQLAGGNFEENTVQGSKQHLGNNYKARFKDKYGSHHGLRSEQLSVHPSHTVDSATLDKSSRSRYKDAVKRKTGSRGTILKPAGAQGIEKLTNDLEGLLHLLKSQKESAQQDEENSQKKVSSVNDNQYKRGGSVAFDVGFIVDGSKAIDEQGVGNFRKCLEFVKEILGMFPVTAEGVHAGLITYGEDSQVRFNFDTDLEHFSAEVSIDSITYPGGESRTGNALYTAMTKLFPHSGRQNVAHVLIVIIGSDSKDEVEYAAQELRAGGVRVFCIGVGGRYDQTQLEVIANSPSDTYVITTKFDTLRNVVPVLESRILANESSGKPTQTPSQSLLSQGGIVESKIDLGFLIDGTETVGAENYRIALDFMKRIYGAFWTQFSSIHLGLVVFGETARLIFDFDNKYVDKTETNKAIDSASFPGGKTALTGEALISAKTHLFGIKHHDSYKRILVLITGTTSTDDIFSGAEMLKANNVNVFCVGVGNQCDKTQLDGIASEPSSNNILTVPSYSNLPSFTQTLVDKIEEARTSYIPPKEPTLSSGRFQRNVSRPGQSSRKPGRGPSIGIPPAVISPQTGQVRPSTHTSPTKVTTLTTPPSFVSPTRHVPGKMPVNAVPTHKPTGKGPSVSKVQPQAPPLVPNEGEKLDLVFLLDGPASMPNNGFDAVKIFIRKLYSNFPIGEDATHVGLVVSGKASPVVFDLTDNKDKQSVDTKVLSTTSTGFERNSLGKGLTVTKENVFDVSARPGGRQVLMVLVAGKSNDDTSVPSRALRDKGVIIFAVGIGNNVDVNQLRDIVSAPEEEHLIARTTAENLDKLLSPMVQNIRKDIAESVVPFGPAGVKIELGFLLDVSLKNLRQDLFQNVLNSVKSIYASFEIGKDKTRVGVVTYGTRPRISVSLNKYTSRQSLDAALDRIVVSPEPASSLGKGLSAVQNELFQGKTRSETPKVLVVVTAGTSTDDVLKPSADLKRLNTTIFCVGVDTNVNRKQLNIVASSPVADHVIMGSISYRESAGENLASRIKKAVQVDIGFLVDGSRNALESDFKQSLDTVKYIYSPFPISREDIHVALGVISSNPEIVFSFDKYFDKQSLDIAVSSIEYPGTLQNLNIGQSLSVANEMLYSSSSRKAVRQILVLLIRGESRDSISDPVRRLRDSGVEIFCLGVGKHVNVSELADIASTPTSKHVVMDNDSNLPRGARDLIDKLQIAKVEQDGGRAPVQPQLAKQPRGAAIDLVVLVERSENTRPEDFERIKEIARSIYRNFRVSQNGVHVAVAFYAEETQIVFNLNTHYDPQKMDSNINDVAYLSGPSMAGKAFRDIKTQIINPNSRQTVPRVVLTIMTGKPNDEMERAVNELKKGCTLMFALGLSSSFSPQSLNQASGQPHSEYLLISETFPEIDLVSRKMADKIKKVVSIDQSRSRRCAQSGDSNLDIVFIVSNCQITANDSFKQQLDFISDLYKSLPLAPQKKRIAIISVANGANILQELTSAPSDQSAVLSAVYTQPADVCTFGKGLATSSSIFKATGVKGVSQLLVVLFAGKSADDISKPSQDLQEAGVLMYTVGFNNTPSKSGIIEMLSTDPVSEFFISSRGFPISGSTKQALLEKLNSVIQISKGLVCSQLMKGCNSNNSGGLQPSQGQPQNINKTSPNVLPVDRGPGRNQSRMAPIDLVFLVEGSDAVNGSLFSAMLDIVKDTLNRFPVSVNRTHVAVAVYATETQIVVNLNDVYNSSKIMEALESVKKPTGATLAGKALREVKSSIYDKTGRTGDVSRILLQILCSVSLDDVIQPAMNLKDEGVKLIAAGACPEAKKAELCNIGSPPLCDNSVLIQTLKPPSSPGRELADRLKKGVPVENVTQPLTGGPAGSSPGSGPVNPSAGPFQPNILWNGTPVQSMFPLAPSLVPVHPPQALPPTSNIWNYEIPIQLDPVAPDPYTVHDNSYLYSPACVDYDPACSGYIGTDGYCDGPAIGYSHDYLMKMCQKSCGLCKTDKDYISEGIWIKKTDVPKITLPQRKPPPNN